MNITDLLVVYSSRFAESPNNLTYTENVPFPKNKDYFMCNPAYAYFLEICAKRNLKAALVTSNDVIGAGLFNGYWTFDNEWKRNNHAIYSSVLFDKFTPVNTKEEAAFQLMTADENIYTFSSKQIKDLFKDKLKTHTTLPEFTIPTAPIHELTPKGIHDALRALSTTLSHHPNAEDFKNGYIIKDQFGLGGKNIYKLIEEKEIPVLLDSLLQSGVQQYIVQPFIAFDKGFSYGNISGNIDIRLIICNKKIIITYIRIAKSGDFRSNVHQGGQRIGIPLQDIPEQVLKISKTVIDRIPGDHTLYTLDFIISNNHNVYLIEGNNNPGLDWIENNTSDEQQQKRLIDAIVTELQVIHSEKTHHETI